MRSGVVAALNAARVECGWLLGNVRIRPMKSLNFSRCTQSNLEMVSAWVVKLDHSAIVFSSYQRMNRLIYALMSRPVLCQGLQKLDASAVL